MVPRQLPNLDHQIYPTNLIAALVAELADAGTEASETLQDSGIAPSQLHAPDTRITYRQILTVFDNALRLAPDSAMPLRAGQRMHFAAYGVVGYTVLSSSTHAASAASAIKYARLVGPVADLDIEQEGDMAVWVYAPTFWRDPADPRYRAAIEFHYASHMRVCQSLYGPGFRISELRLACAAPAHASSYQSLFQCPVLFEQARNELRYDARRMNEPMAYASAVTHATVRDMCEQHLAQVNQSAGLGGDIYRMLVQSPGPLPNAEAMAVAMSMNARSLRRRLETEGTSYRQLLGQVREHLALAYLRKTSMTHEEIAVRLGYSDAANFRHAFIRWTGKNPSEFRRK